MSTIKLWWNKPPFKTFFVIRFFIILPKIFVDLYSSPHATAEQMTLIRPVQPQILHSLLVPITLLKASTSVTHALLIPTSTTNWILWCWPVAVTPKNAKLNTAFCSTKFALQRSQCRFNPRLCNDFTNASKCRSNGRLAHFSSRCIRKLYQSRQCYWSIC